MEVEITNLVGLIHLKMELHSKITLLCSEDNGAGKTSALDPIKQALTGAFDDAKDMVREGHASGMFKLKSEDIDYEVTYPTCKPVVSGVIKASPYSSGLRRLAEEKPIAISEYLQKLLNTEPTKVDLGKALKEQGILKGKSVDEAKAYIEAVWTNIQRRGWPNAHKDYQERGRQSKADWKAVTGETWGSAKAGIWSPPHWEDELLAKSKEGLESELAEANAILEASVRHDAVQVEKREEYQTLASRRSEIAKLRDEAIIEHDKIQAECKEAVSKYDKMPRPASKVRTFNCPHCEKPIDSATHGKPPEAQTPEEIKALEDALEAAESVRNDWQNKLAPASNTVLKYREEFGRAENAEKLLAAMDKQMLEEQPSEQMLEEQRRNVEIARQRVEAYSKKMLADKHHAEVERNQKLIDLLDPSGWRQSFTANALKKLNDDYLKPQCEIVGTKLIEIDRSLNITWGGRNYRRLSTGQKWPVSGILQIALARLEEATLMVFDGADVMGGPSRNGFLRLLASVPIPSVVSMTQSRKRLPQIVKRGHGRIYWIEDCTGLEVKDELELASV